MKKALALILTVAMLLSCVSMGVFAAREFSVSTEVETNSYWKWDEDNCYVYLACADDSNYTMSMNLRLDKDTSNFAGYFGDCLTMNVDGIGVNNNNLPYDFTVGEWYAVELACDGSSTVISVNGEVLGTVGKLNKDWCGGVFDISMDNFSTPKFDEDFEDGSFENKSDTNGYVAKDEIKTETIVNDNVSKAELSNKYWKWDEDNCYVYLACAGSSNYTMSMDLRLDKETSNFAGYFGDCLTMNVDGIGIAGNNLAYDFEVGTWYSVELACDGSSTVISVNGEALGTVGVLNKDWCGGVFDISMDNFKTERFDEDFEDGSFDNKSDTNGYVATATTAVELARYALGEKYWKWDEDNCYVYVACADDSDYTMSMDICLDKETSNFAGYFGDCLTMNVDGVGIAGNNIPYEFVPGTWYHLELACNGSSTVISVDDVEIGTVGKLNKDWCGGVFDISIDNFSTPKFDEDFEDGEWQNKSDTNGYVASYDFGIVEPEPVDPLAGLPKYEVGGDAILLEADAGNNYMLMNVPTEAGNTGYISFDMAMIDNGYEDGLEGFEGAHSIEFWRYNNGGFSRFTVGEKVGRDTNLVDYEWGELSAENFHNIVVKYAADENRGGSVYAYFFIDGVQVGAETGYLAYTSWPGNNFIINIWNSSAIIDNFYVYDAEMNSIGASLLDTREHTSSYDPAVVNLDYEGTYCEANGCIWGGIVRKSTETCTTLGYDMLMCGECGEQIGEDIERPMLSHIFNKFDKYQISDGYYYVTCKDCNETRYSKVPSEAAYTGDITAYFDMSDDLFGKLRNEPNCEILGSIEGSESYMGDNMRYEGGKGVCDADSYVANYQPLPFGSILAQGVDSSNFSVSFDITVNAIEPWVEGYENAQSLHFWMKGVTIEAGYDAVNKQIYMRPANGGAFDEWVEDYELVEGQTYNFKVSAIFDDEAEWGGIYITIDGEDIIAYDDDNMFGVYYDMKLGEGNLNTIYFRNMGVAFTMDNLVVGSADFAWVDLAGDLDDNKAIDAADALTMRKYLAKVLGDADVDMTRMDVNGDDAINAKDQLAIRKALVA